MGAEALSWWKPTQEAHPPVDSVKRRVGVQLKDGVLVQRLMIAGLQTDDALALLAHPENADYLQRLVLNEYQRGILLSGASLPILQIRKAAIKPPRAKSGRVYSCRVIDTAELGAGFCWHDRLCYVAKEGIIQSATALREEQYEALCEEEGLLRKWKTPSLRRIIDALPVAIEQDIVEVHFDDMPDESAVVQLPRDYDRSAYRQPPRIPRWLTKPGVKLTVIVIDAPTEADKRALGSWARCHADWYGLERFFVDPNIRMRLSQDLIPDGFDGERLPIVPKVDWSNPAHRNSIPDEIRRWIEEGFGLIKNLPESDMPVMLWSPSTLVTFLETFQGHGGWNGIEDLLENRRAVQFQFFNPKFPLFQLSWI